MKILSPKVIADPLYGIIDIRQVLPMVETPEFQSLAYKYQTGMNFLVFPSATHTRRAHSIGAYHATTLLTDNWLRLDFINKDEALTLRGYALYHDIGHTAFSHVTEPLFGLNNDERGREIIKRLRAPIEKCGLNFSLLEDFFERKNALYLAVHDKNLGMEKLDYLERDGFYTILSRPAGVSYLREHIYFIENKLVIDEKVVDNAKDVQDFYMKMYKNVYLRKAAVIAQRMVQKMVYGLLRSNEYSLEDLAKLNDFEMMGAFSRSRHPITAALYRNLLRRHLFKESIVVRFEDFVHAEHVAGKTIALFGAKPEQMEMLIRSQLLQQNNPAGMDALETQIAKLAGVPEEALLVVPITSPERFQAKDILIYTDNGKLDSMKARYPGHFKDMEETARAYTALRVCSLEEYREKLSDPLVAKKIFDLILENSRT